MKKLYLTMIFSMCFIMISGCVSLHTKYIEQKQFALNIPAAKSRAGKSAAIIEVYSPEVVPQFAGASFVYRVSDLNYITDYYNVFFGAPSEQLQQIITQHLQATGMFQYVAENVAPLNANYILKAYVTELYADYRNVNAPTAVIALRFVLLGHEDESGVVLNKNFREVIPLQQRTPEALVTAWDVGLKKILGNFATELRYKLN